MLLTPFSFIWVFQILIGYSKFLRNAHLPILLFSIGFLVDIKISMIRQTYSLPNGS